MTPEERERMNELCVQIQEEKNYDQFAVQLRELKPTSSLANINVDSRISPNSSGTEIAPGRLCLPWSTK